MKVNNDHNSHIIIKCTLIVLEELGVEVFKVNELRGWKEY